MKRNGVLLCLFFGLYTVLYAYPPMKINDKGVRLREKPGLSGKIIRILEKGEAVTKIARQRHEDDHYFWINVKTETGEGWVYGQFVSLAEESTDYKFRYIDDARVLVNNGIIGIGTTKDVVIKLLGKPLSIDYDEASKEEWYEFDYKGRLAIIISQKNLVVRIMLYGPEQILVNKCKVGMNINVVASVNELRVDSLTSYFKGLPNYFKKSEYDCHINFTTDAKGIIKDIDISGNWCCGGGR